MYVVLCTMGQNARFTIAGRIAPRGYTLYPVCTVSFGLLQSLIISYFRGNAYFVKSAFKRFAMKSEPSTTKMTIAMNAMTESDWMSIRLPRGI